METDNFGAEDIMWILRYRLPNGHLRCGVPQFQAVGSVAFLVLTRIGILVLLAFHGFRKLCPHVAGAQWGNKKHMNMKHLEAAIEDASIVG